MKTSNRDRAGGVTAISHAQKPQCGPSQCSLSAVAATTSWARGGDEEGEHRVRCYWDCCLAPVAPQRICVTPLNHELLLRQPAGIPRIETEFAESYYSYKSAIFARVSRLGLGKGVGVGGGGGAGGDSWLCFLTLHSWEVPDSGHSFGSVAAFCVKRCQLFDTSSPKTHSDASDGKRGTNPHGTPGSAQPKIRMLWCVHQHGHGVGGGEPSL